MLIEKITPRKVVTLGTNAKLYANSALSITMELKDENIEGISYQVTLTDLDLSYMQAIINERLREIQKFEDVLKEQVING